MSLTASRRLFVRTWQELWGSNRHKLLNTGLTTILEITTPEYVEIGTVPQLGVLPKRMLAYTLRKEMADRASSTGTTLTCRTPPTETSARADRHRDEILRFGRALRRATSDHDRDIIFEYVGCEAFLASVFLARHSGCMVILGATSGCAGAGLGSAIPKWGLQRSR